MKILPIVAPVLVAVAIILDFIAAVAPGWTVLGNISIGTMYQCISGTNCAPINSSSADVFTAIVTLGALIPLTIGLICMALGWKNEKKSKYTIGSVVILITALLLIIALAVYGVATIVVSAAYGYSFDLGWVAVILGIIGGALGLAHALSAAPIVPHKPVETLAGRSTSS